MPISRRNVILLDVMNIYAELTKEFNQGRLRAILSSGQAVVMHKLAIMSKDGDWILRESEETMKHVLGVLSSKGARYRFGAPLDCRWLRGGWSSHFEFRKDILRVRTDFVARPPRILYSEILKIFNQHENSCDQIPFLNAKHLAEIKKTNREKDYAVIGELARLLTKPEDILMLSRSAREIEDVAEQYPELLDKLVSRRPALSKAGRETEVLEAALDAERRELMHANEKRLQRYMNASEEWASLWPKLLKKVEGMPLLEAHAIIAIEAEGVLPVDPCSNYRGFDCER